MTLGRSCGIVNRLRSGMRVIDMKYLVKWANTFSLVLSLLILLYGHLTGTLQTSVYMLFFFGLLNEAFKMALEVYFNLKK